MIKFLSLLILGCTLVARAESTTDKLTTAGIAEFTSAYQTWDARRFASASDLFHQAITNSPDKAANYYWLGAARFHLMLQLQTGPDKQRNEAASTAALEAAMEALSTAVKLDESHAESHALLGTLYGMKINGSPMRGIRLGPRVAKHQALALKHGASNPRVMYLLGMCQFHTAKKPAAWREALETLLASERLFDKEARTTAAPLSPRWGYDSSLTFIGRTYESLNQPTQAADYFRKALAVHPQDHTAEAGLKRIQGEK